MRLQTLLSTALLAATTFAAEDSPNESAASPSPDPTPAGALWSAKWDTADLQPYQRKCLNRNTYTAKIYKLSELYPDLKEFAPDLKIFYNKQLYAGSWSGHDAHGEKRELMRMSTSSLPYKVREWLKKTPKQKHFNVQDDNVFFAPGAIYPILPLWVDEPEDAECEDVFDDLDLYSNEPADGKVVGKLSHTYDEDKEVTFTVEAMVLKGKGKAPTRKEGQNDEL
ncbi:hypothetical protein HBI56_151390 [Parastagonospora nodorum]|uniref:Uncharacterized protein n=2 Tax=Phaeosphaeria nodorum (strain SN15 / ATCC MYA-4574 / FGSC 10173) TaxID=321614 RepID=A0A7U2I6Y1_PHANO|nr:hypothetical protein SNOG_12893 [Parastagonospora nodorum SN15]KAH3907938.1 hypothetical protein HBH56_183120 [Parastagonospora nodorum]EAT79693.1 hypothetical protein SNOG_12893 [Parastagonospora nodorum SN15]KAH3926003.1 hypothetical protein HBH54_172270 [Parastagonospora nodorum]KAH3944751.1 hypothetical protein HBH53_152640 [Parastagonospora nodorum]KAH3962475.1 hypothetical protein HBH52_223770 [Parastagonospora nodorum]